jgi:signal peptidase I
MTSSEWILFFLALQGVHFLGTWKLYRKSGRKAWEALVPIYNAVVLMQIINRPKWWVVLLFVPVINLLLFPVLWVETSRSFGKNSTAATWLSFLSLGFYLYYLNYMADVTYVTDRDLKPKSALGEWVSSILFAVIAATLVHTYVMQPYTIPTSSLEKSLLVGDFLFVSKFHYGARVPMTPIAAPMVHDTLPLLGIRSYLKKPAIPYLRIPGFQKIKRNDIVVFNWPTDTVQQFFKRPDRKIVKPIDKKSNYVKRCVAIAGDSLEIRGGDIYINGSYSEMPERAKPQFFYKVDTKGFNLSENSLYNKYQVRRGEWGKRERQYILNLDEEHANKMKKNPFVKSIQKTYEKKVRQKGCFHPPPTNGIGIILVRFTSLKKEKQWS